jgi:hypothetical protein
MFKPLAEQLGLVREFVPWASGGNKDDVVQPDLLALHESVQKVSKSLWRSKRAAATS